MDDVIDKNVPLTVFQDGYTEMRKDAHTSFGFENDADEDEAIIDFNFNNLFLDPNQTNPADDITQIYDLIAEYFFAFALVFLFIYFTLCGIVYVGKVILRHHNEVVITINIFNTIALSDVIVH